MSDETLSQEQNEIVNAIKDALKNKGVHIEEHSAFYYIDGFNKDPQQRVYVGCQPNEGYRDGEVYDRYFVEVFYVPKVKLEEGSDAIRDAKTKHEQLTRIVRGVIAKKQSSINLPDQHGF